MNITIASVQALNPCQSRFDNFKNNYPGFSGTSSDFLALDKITYSDKVWVMLRLFNQKQKVRFAAACAQSVLEIFEKKYPNDKRPRLAIEAALTWADSPTEENRIKALEARRNGRDAAAYAAYAAADAAAAAAYADAAAYAAYAAADAAYATTRVSAREAQQDLNLMYLNQIAMEAK